MPIPIPTMPPHPSVSSGTLLDHAARAAAAADRFATLWEGAETIAAEETIEPETQACDQTIDAAIAAALAAPPASNLEALKAKAAILKAALSPDGEAGREDIRLLVRALVLDVLALGEAMPRQ